MARVIKARRRASPRSRANRTADQSFAGSSSSLGGRPRRTGLRPRRRLAREDSLFSFASPLRGAEGADTGSNKERGGSSSDEVSTRWSVAVEGPRAPARSFESVLRGAPPSPSAPSGSSPSPSPERRRSPRPRTERLTASPSLCEERVGGRLDASSPAPSASSASRLRCSGPLDSGDPIEARGSVGSMRRVWVTSGSEESVIGSSSSAPPVASAMAEIHPDLPTADEALGVGGSSNPVNDRLSSSSPR